MSVFHSDNCQRRWEASAYVAPRFLWVSKEAQRWFSQIIYWPDDFPHKLQLWCYEGDVPPASLTLFRRDADLRWPYRRLMESVGESFFTGCHVRSGVRVRPDAPPPPQVRAPAPLPVDGASVPGKPRRLGLSWGWQVEIETDKRRERNKTIRPELPT